MEALEATNKQLVQEVIDRRRSEIDLRESETRYRSLVESSADGIFVLKAGRVIYANPAMLRLIGAESPDQVLGKTPYDLIHPDYHDVARQRLRRIHETRQPAPYMEKKYVKLDGTPVDVEVSGVPFEDHGELAIHVTARDIRERKRVAQALEASETRFRLLFDHAADGLFLHDRHGYVVDVNKQACVDLGYSRGELIGKHPVEFDPDVTMDMVSEILARLEKGEVFTFESRHRRKDGVNFPVEIRFCGLEFLGQRLGLSMVRNVTERKRVEVELRESEQRFRGMFAVASVGIAQVDPVSARFLLANDKMCEITGYTQEEMLRITVGQLTHPDDRESDQAIFLKAARGEIPQYINEKRYVRKDGSIAWVRVNAAFIRNESGQPKRTVALIEDITSRKHAEEALRLAHEQLARGVAERTEELAKLKAVLQGEMLLRQQLETQMQDALRLESMSVLAGSIAHELNQPLTAIVNYSKGCINRLGIDQKNELTEAMQKVAVEALRAGSLIRRLRELTTSRPPNFTPNHLNDTIRSALFLIEPFTRGKGVTVTAEFADGLPVAEFDHLLITQVVLNLLNNGLDAMTNTAPGEQKLTVETGLDGNSHLKVSVHDLGVGLTEEWLGRLFTPFQSSKPGGMGLGLTVCKNIIELHGGRMWATPRNDRVASFSFTLPCGTSRCGL